MFGSSRYSDNPITWSLPIGRLFGIRIKLHLLFILIAVVFVLKDTMEGNLVRGLGSTAILFAIVLLHEFGHCFGARYAGGRADEILLWPLGGLAYTQPPHRPGAHLVTTLAGPLVNVILCGMTATFLVVSHPSHALGVVPWNPFDLGLAAIPPATELQSWVALAFYVSYLLLLFNLVPMFPLDGGRVVQEVMWFRIGYGRATMIACTTGMVGAIVLGCVGLLSEEFLLLGIAIFGYFTCWQQKQMLRATEGMHESEFGYDFSQGYTSLNQSERDDAAPARPSFLSRWSQARAERARRREVEQQAADERKLDELLDKVHRDGIQSLTPAERRFLEQASSKRR